MEILIMKQMKKETQTMKYYYLEILKKMGIEINLYYYLEK